MGWAERTKTGAQIREAREQRRQVLLKRRVLMLLRGKIAHKEPLTDADHRIIAQAGPKTLEFLGYQPSVTLQ